MSISFGKNVISCGPASQIGRDVRREGKLDADTYPGTIGTFDSDTGVFKPGNSGNLNVLDCDFLSGLTAQQVVKAGQKAVAIIAKTRLFLNCILDKNLSVKVDYPLYVTTEGFVTNIKPAEGNAEVFGYAAEAMTTSDTTKLVAVHLA